MKWTQTRAFFDKCRKALAEQTVLSRDSIDLAFDSDFEVDFEAAPRRLWAYWREETKAWEEIAAHLGKAVEEIKKLSPPAKAASQHVI
ncbi:hypothetical protein [Pseudaestuariivita sp.]|uniref:hypothetical protein n=1 Tax=Pseudaestuariivita sp. TaxID=2211669 RepID=UPI004059797C